MFMQLCVLNVGPSSTVSVYLQVMNFQVVNTKFGIPMVTVKKHTSPSLHQVSRQLLPPSPTPWVLWTGDDWIVSCAHLWLTFMYMHGHTYMWMA